jgi:hypothetical protein
MRSFVKRHMRKFEMIGVLMRIFSFSLVSWLGPEVWRRRCVWVANYSVELGLGQAGARLLQPDQR